MDLHDQTLADLTRLARRLERLHAGASPDDLAGLSDGLHQAMGHLRQIIETAKPSVLHLFGFAQAVENHLDRAIRDSGQPVRGTLTDHSDGALDALDPTVAIALFRIVQEAANNAVSHARAGQVRIDLAVQGGQVSVVVEDDGIGFARSSTRSGSGIDNMKTRAHLIDARFAMTCGAGERGTRVALSLAAPTMAQARRAAQ